MKQWNEIFKNHGRVFNNTHEDLPKISEIFKKRKIKKILDFGSGSGRHVIYLAKQGFDVDGFDISEEGIRQTSEWLKKEKLNAQLKIGSIYDKLPYEENNFDAVISTNVIHHGGIEDVRRAIAEIERILKPNGLIFITVRRRGVRKWREGKIVERYGKQLVNYKVIAPRTYAPTEGGEKDLPHFLFNKKLIKKEFKNFMLEIWLDSNKRHYCLLGELQSK